MTKRDASGSDFDPSSFDDVRELVDRWTTRQSMTAPQIVDALRARGVVVRSTTSGRHVIVEARGRHPDEPAEARLFVMPPAAPCDVAPPSRHRVREPSPPRGRVIHPPGERLHWVAGLFSKRTRERVLDPIIADMQVEYCEVLAGERPRKLQLWLIQARAWAAFAEAIFLRTVIGRIINGLSRLV